MKKQLITTLLLSLALLSTSLANTAIRSWTRADGTHFKAMIMGWDAQSDLVTLSDDAGTQSQIKRTDLGLADQAYVRQWFKHRKKLDTKLKEMGGSMEFKQTTGTYQTDYYVYKPSTYLENGTAPILILFSSSGTGYRMMLRHFEAAEKTGMILITLDYFKNHIPDTECFKHFKEMLPQLETIKHDPKKLYLGGDSGGALLAYRMSAEFDRPWAGIYANGGWLERDYTMQVRTGMHIAMVNGHKDRAALNFTKKDTDYLAEKRLCNVALFSFEGAHQLAPTDSQIEVFNWLLNKETSSNE